MSEIDKFVSDLKLLNSNNWSDWVSNQKVKNIIDDQVPKIICRHQLDFTVTITLKI